MWNLQLILRIQHKFNYNAWLQEKKKKKKEERKKKRLQKISICFIELIKLVILNGNFSLYSYFF